MAQGGFLVVAIQNCPWRIYMTLANYLGFLVIESFEFHTSLASAGNQRIVTFFLGRETTCIASSSKGHLLRSYDKYMFLRLRKTETPTNFTTVYPLYGFLRQAKVGRAQYVLPVLRFLN